MPIVNLVPKRKLAFWGSLVIACIAVVLLAWNIRILGDKETVDFTPSPLPSVKQEVLSNTPTYKYRESPSPVAKKTVVVTPTPDPDPIVNCQFEYNGAIKLRQSECSKSFECQIKDKWYIYTSREKCTSDQKINTSTINYTHTPYVLPTYITPSPYTASPIASPTNQPISTPKPFDSSLCYSQYNSDINKANTYSSSVGDAIRETAKQNLDKCLASGTVTAVGNFQTTQHCYASWDEYFQAHPNLSGTNVSGGNPPCD